MVDDPSPPGGSTPSRPLGFVLLVLAVLVFLGAGLAWWVGAFVSSPTDGGTHPGAAATAGASRSGCGISHRGSSQLTMILGTGLQMAQRTALVRVPAGYTGSRPLPLVLNMHGSGSSSAGEESLTDMDATADRDGFIVVYPQAVIADGPGYDWNVPNEPLVGGGAVPLNAPNDVTFLTELVGIVSHHYCVDLRRVYATGFSGGARMASQLACDSPTTFAAVAAVSGLRFPTPCKPSRAVPVLAFHGTADPVEPFRGAGTGYWTYSVPTAEQEWAHEDGCAPVSTITHPAATVTLTRYGHCEDSASVELYTISGEGHQWPGGPKQLPGLVQALGPQTNAIDADNVIWAFFASHPMP